MIFRAKLLGDLQITDTPFYEAFTDPSVNSIVAASAAGVLVVGAIVVVILLSVFHLWKPLWKDWLTSTDHKRIGIMYIVVGIVMLIRGILEGVVMRGHQAFALNGQGPLEPEHYAELFSTHGTIMILFVAVPVISGMINYLLPLHIGARDMAFPVMNQVSLGLLTAGAALVMISLAVGKFETGGWTAYPPYTGKVFSPGVGPDYWIWAVVISGIGSMLSGINFATTIFKCRAPGMSYYRMSLFTWTALCSAIMLVYAMPAVTVSSLMLAMDRYLDFHFFTNDLGGNMMNYANIFWMFGHPEVYILVLPAYGIWSEIVSTYTAKPLYGYTGLVIATMSIAVIAFTVWVHHFFTMGQSATVNIVFGIATMVIAVPTGVKVYDWMATIWRGRVRITTPMVYMTGFFILFVIGGLSGVMLANPTLDYQVHNSLFLVAHFHNVLIPGVLFAVFAAIHHWWPKVFGFRLDEKWGQRAAWTWIFGFCFTFLPLYWLGLMGMPRRAASFTNPDFVIWERVAGFGSLIILLAFSLNVIGYIVSIRNRKKLAVPLGDPWDGRTLEWSTPSPVPEWNYPVVPQVHARDAFAYDKAHGQAYLAPEAYEDIEMPNPTAIGFSILVSTTLLGFALIWHIWWLAIVSFAIIPLSMIFQAFKGRTHHMVPAYEVKKFHENFLNEVRKTDGITRDFEETARNKGLAAPDVVAGE